MAITNAQLAQQISDFVDRATARDDSFENWMFGVAGGGPDSDGRYALIDYMGRVFYAKSPAQLEADVEGVVDSALSYSQSASKSATTATQQAVLSKDEADRTALLRDEVIVLKDTTQNVHDDVINIRNIISGWRDEVSLNTQTVLDARDATFTARDLTMQYRDTAEQYKLDAEAAALAADQFDPANYVPVTDLGATDGVATLDGAGKIPIGQLPGLAITETFVVNSESEMLALNVQKGDVAVRNDLEKSYILAGTDPTVLSNWQVLKSPTDQVQSVDGRTGVVTLGDLYSPIGHGHNWGDLSGIPATATRWPSFSEVSGKPSTYTPSSHTHSWSDITSGIPATATRWPSFSEVSGKPSITTRNTEYSSIGSDGWYTIAEGDARTHGRFLISDDSSGRHNIITIEASGAYGKFSVNCSNGVRYGNPTIANVRIIYESSDRVYGTYKLQVYCLSSPFNLSITQHTEAGPQAGWSDWTLIPPTKEGLPTGYSEEPSARIDDVAKQEGGAVFSKLYGRGVGLTDIPWAGLIGIPDTATRWPNPSEVGAVEQRSYNNGARLHHAWGGRYYGSSNSTGAIIIDVGTQNIMLDAEITVYSYQRIIKLHVGGYTYQAGSGWYNPKVVASNSLSEERLPVRFMKNGNSRYIVIGNTDTIWSYPHVTVGQVRTGYGGVFNAEWPVSISTSYPGTTDHYHVIENSPETVVSSSNPSGGKHGDIWFKV